MLFFSHMFTGNLRLAHATKGYQGTFSWTVRPKCGRFHLRMVQLALLRMKSQTHVSGHCVYAVYNEFLCSLSRQLQVYNFALKVVQTLNLSKNKKTAGLLLLPSQF